jgi:hypothetical protein
MQGTCRINPKPFNPNIHGVEKGEARHRKFGSGQVYNHSANCSFRVVM